MEKSYPYHRVKLKNTEKLCGIHKTPKYSINGRTWISNGKNTFLGYGRVVLLERIREHGSITKAAKSMGMSYRIAWELVASMNNQANKLLVDRYTGGKGGGGAVVTKYGERAIALFWKLQFDFTTFFEKKRKELSKLYD